MADRDVKPAFNLVEEASGHWKIGLVNLQKFEEVLGRDVLNAFCRCFVHSDRLTSTNSCIYASEQLHGSDSIAYGRDLLTMEWFTIGTMRELALALQALRSALKKRGLLDSDSAPWVTLRELEERWEGDEFFRRKRDVAAFHVDERIVDDGLMEMLKESRVATLAEGDGKKAVKGQLPVGMLALHKGLGLSLEGYGDFIHVVSEDHGRASEAIQMAFIHACETAGIPFEAD